MFLHKEQLIKRFNLFDTNTYLLIWMNETGQYNSTKIKFLRPFSLTDHYCRHYSYYRPRWMSALVHWALPVQVLQNIYCSQNSLWNTRRHIRHNHFLSSGIHWNCLSWQSLLHHAMHLSWHFVPQRHCTPSGRAEFASSHGLSALLTLLKSKTDKMTKLLWIVCTFFVVVLVSKLPLKLAQPPVTNIFCDKSSWSSGENCFST